ncbi:FxLYD domain-containing protein [Streptomyces europaeiscabiei]|uniref:FxLYD domain-containing protein n=1 Tax=Streptomyces europaeiscabiei TaxID=146819 RepID=A0ABU4NYS1_9ACTN|nr:FxLYD domain-containing protein [Streptomyces europaeiscabiei]MDX2759116.1 FxLYD domain-containing protein [Streptomyces europaeiscabiei]MDX3549742.1 FxLYD domain-containing protein [Streptomyces europaeiscabiei]MDX3558784.1 FxLYD domain-containing protein [Streptomyces europaeiscabiei]MDX3707083.1 FxLYD domain-containing protein [Streptomyces europaeiscabiei]
MRTRIHTITALAVGALLALTACGSNVNDKSRGYNADNLSQSETSFMDVVYDVSADKDAMRDSTAGEMAKAVKAFQLFCLAGEGERAQKMDDENKLSDADHKRLNQAFADHLCTGDEAKTGEGDAEESKAPEKSAHDADVKVTQQGSKTEYGTTTYDIAFTVTNSGDEAANYWIEFEAYDKDGDFLGSTGSSVERLGPGKTKTDETSFYDETVENGKLADIDTVKIKKVEYCDGSDDDPIMCQI